MPRHARPKNDERKRLHSAPDIHTDPATGGKKEVKAQRFSLLPPDFLWELAQLYGFGTKKYAARNWELGYDWGLSLDAAQRHLHLWWIGEDTDPESQVSHLTCAVWHLIALWWFHRHKRGTNTIRP